MIQALRCCRDILLSRGFKEAIPCDLASTSLNDHKERVVFVAGCQTEALLEARVESALRLIRTLAKPVHVAFVGGAPPKKNPESHTNMPE